MLIFDSLNKGERPLRLLAWSVLGGLVVLTFGLWRIQILNGHRYKERQLVQSFRSVRVPAVRGRILDRDGQVLADSRPRYRLDLYLDELAPQFDAEYRRQRRELIAIRGGNARPNPGLWSRVLARLRRTKTPPLITSKENENLLRGARYSVVSNLMSMAGARLGTNIVHTEAVVYRHWYNQRYLPFPMLDSLTDSQVAIITEQGWNYPGLELEQVPTRTYPQRTTAAHILGQLKRDEAADPDEPEYDYHLPDYRGVKGLEFLDRPLRGQPGAKSILVNSGGYRVGERVLIESIPGQTMTTTLDLLLQQECERSLNQVSGEERGAVVVLDCRNGDILAMASAPTFDPNCFLSRISPPEYERLNDNVLRPMSNRATDEIYAPGSTFKVFTALGLMDAGVALDEEFEVKVDPARAPRGAYWLGTRKIEDTVLADKYDFHRAFIKSSNSYFIDHTVRPGGMGMKRFLDFGRRFGFGESTHLRVTRDEAGIFPQYGETLANGQTYDGRNKNALADASIGQQIAMTPLQLAIAYAAVANGGTVFWPRIISRMEPGDVLSDRDPDTVRPGQVRSRLGLNPDHLARVQAAMRDDVADPQGTGIDAQVEGFAVCGKTGTAEIKGNGRKDKVTWFASFGPFEQPRYVVIVMVESGRSGGRTCAPVAGRIYQFLHQRVSGPRMGQSTAAGGDF